MTRDITRGNPLSNLLVFVIPIFAGNMLQQLYNTVDTVIVGQFIGKDALVAVGTSQPIIMIMVSAIIGLNIGTEILLSQQIGVGDSNRIHIVANTMFRAVIILSLVLGVLGFLFAKNLLIFIQTPEEVLADATLYLKIYFIGLPGLAGYNTLNGMIRSTGNTVHPLIFLAIASVLNIALDIVFIYWFAWGVAGVALATIIAQGVSFLLCFLKLKKIRSDLHLGLSRALFEWGAFRRGFSLGIPGAIQTSAMSLATFVTQILMNTYSSTDAISAYVIGMKVDTFTSLPVTSLSLAMITLVGQNVGAGNEKMAKAYEKYGIYCGIAFAVVMSTVMAVGGEWLVKIFISGEETAVVAYGAAYIRSVSLAYVFIIYGSIVCGVIRGRGNTTMPMVISMVSIWCVRVPLLIILVQRFGFVGLCIAVPVSWLTNGLHSFGYVQYCKIKEKRRKKYE